MHIPFNKEYRFRCREYRLDCEYRFNTDPGGGGGGGGGGWGEGGGGGGGGVVGGCDI